MFTILEAKKLVTVLAISASMIMAIIEAVFVMAPAINICIIILSFKALVLDNFLLLLKHILYIYYPI